MFGKGKHGVKAEEDRIRMRITENIVVEIILGLCQSSGVFLKIVSLRPSASHEAGFFHFFRRARSRPFHAWRSPGWNRENTL